MDHRAYYDENSGERTRARRIRLRPRFFITVGLLAAVVVLLVALLGRPPLYTVGYGALDTVNSGLSALVIRDEDIYTIGAYIKFEPYVLEGQDVTRGEPIIGLFEGSNIESLEQELRQKRESIAARLQETLLSRIVNQDLDTLNDLIGQKVAELMAIAKDGPGDAAATEKALRALMAQKQEYIKQTNVAVSDDALTQLYADEIKLLARIEEQKITYTAGRDGRVSMYMDGLEYFLHPDTITQLTKVSGISAFIKGDTPEGYSQYEASMPLFRIVNPELWYLLFAIDTTDWSYALNDVIDVYIDGYDGIGAEAKVFSMRQDGSQTIVALEITKDIGSLLGKRSATVTIGKRIEGLMVPKSAIKTEGAQTGVYALNSDGAFTFVPVAVLQQADYDKNALVLPVQAGEIDKGSIIRAR